MRSGDHPVEQGVAEDGACAPLLNAIPLDGSMTNLSEARQELEQLKCIAPTPDGALVDLLLQRLARWNEDDSSVDDLVSELDRILGGVWFSNNERHAAVALTLAKLRDTAAAVGGMTMNERLAAFDLFTRWDRSSESQREILYRKVLAVC